MQDVDCGDQLLEAERMHLFSMKRYLEAQLGRVQAQLQQLNKARAQLMASIQERSRVTDLLCQSMTPSSQYQSGSTSLRSSSTRQIWNGKGRNGLPMASSRSQSVLLNGFGHPANGISTGSFVRRRRHPQTLSAPATSGNYMYTAETVGELKR